MTGKKKSKKVKKKTKKHISLGGIELGATGVKGPHATPAPRQHERVHK